MIDNAGDNDGRLPNYAVPGINTTKTFSISSMLSNLIEEYSQAKGVSQKDMLQISMVEFLMNHGYKEEKKYIDQMKILVEKGKYDIPQQANRAENKNSFKDID